MVTLEKSDMGFVAYCDGEKFADVHCCETTCEATFSSDGGKPVFKSNQYKRKPWPADRWKIHFTGRPVPVDVVANLLKALTGISVG